MPLSFYHQIYLFGDIKGIKIKKSRNLFINSKTKGAYLQIFKTIRGHIKKLFFLTHAFAAKLFFLTHAFAAKHKPGSSLL